MLEIGDVLLIKEDGHGFVEENIGKYVEVVGFGDYFDESGVQVVPYECELESPYYGYEDSGVVGLGSFEDNPMILLNTRTVDQMQGGSEDKDFGKHYRHSFRLNLTQEDIDRGYVMVNCDPYRISEIYQLGGWKEHLVKKAIRGTEKGHTEDELIAELQCTLDRAKQMREESKE